MMKITNHLLQPAEYMPSPNHGGPLQVQDTIVIHYTAGGDALSASRWLCKTTSQASTHVVVGRDATIYQLVPFDVEAWHAGQSAYVFPDGTRRESYNHCSIGIELDNAGILEPIGDEYISWFRRSYPSDQVYFGTHRNEYSPRYWHRYTEAQIMITEEICRLVISQYGVKYILGHEEISPIRKVDPGPAFPLDKLRQRIFHPRSEDGVEDQDEKLRFGLVIAPQLNIRSGPGSSEPTIARPLDRGARVKILGEDGGWYRISVEMEGWVSKQHIEVQLG